MEPFENRQAVGDDNQSTTSKQLFHSSWRGTLKTTTLIIRGDTKLFYNCGLFEWDEEKGYLMDTCLSAQDKFKKWLDYFKIEYTE